MIDLEEVKKLLNNSDADNIICRKLELIPSNIAKYITEIANNENDYGYVIIGASKNYGTYCINGISNSLKFDGIIKEAVNQLEFDSVLESNKYILEGKYVYIIRIEKNIIKSNANIIIDDKLMKLINDLFSACMKLQRNFIYKNASEDQRNDYIRDILETNKYSVKDQTRQGTSNSGKASGEVDILIHEQGIPLTIIEALNLDSFKVDYLDTHIDKVYKYDTLGNPYNFIISYVKVKDFKVFMDKYYQHIKNYKYPYKLIRVDKKENEYFNKFPKIQIIITELNRDNKSTLLCHICVKIPE
ncbi:hypothetical protein [Clostridium butyricum]